MNRSNPPLPLSYRADLLRQILPRLQAGECCSLVGISGVGKSNLVNFLRRPDVQAIYWDHSLTWIVLIDTHSLVFGEQPVEYIVAELMIHRLIMEAERRSLSDEFVTWADELHLRLAHQPSAHMAFRYLERICAQLCEQHNIQIIFVFDQFEDLWQTAPVRFFLNLRNVRDQFKYQVVYLLFTRERLQRTREDLREVEAFWELFASHIYGLGMYSHDDAHYMLERLASRCDDILEPSIREQALTLSGHHPGLLRAVFWALCRGEYADDPGSLLHTPAIAEECAKIWNDFLPDEQRLLHVIASEQPLYQPDETILAELRLKEILVNDPPTIFAPILQAYIRKQSGSDVSGMIVHLQLRQVWVDGQLLPKQLSRLEFDLLAYLAKHAGTVCSREDILTELYGEQIYDVNDERIDTLLRRLRSALNEDARNPRYLFTHRGVGLQLKDGRVQ